MEVNNTEFYQIRLYAKDRIEIFQNVFFHKIHLDKGVPCGIMVSYSSSQNTGLATHSMRPTEDVYDVKIINEPKYEPTSDHPKRKKIIIH